MSGRVMTQRGRSNAARGAYELSDMDPKVAGLTIAGLAGVVLLVALGTAGLLLSLGAIRQPDAPVPQLLAPAPALQVNERNDRIRIDTRSRARRDGPGREARIDRAMRQVAQNGWDAPR